MPVASPCAVSRMRSTPCVVAAVGLRVDCTVAVFRARGCTRGAVRTGAVRGEAGDAVSVSCIAMYAYGDDDAARSRVCGVA
jgi:hypothetical protein